MKKIFQKIIKNKRKISTRSSPKILDKIKNSKIFEKLSNLIETKVNHQIEMNQTTNNHTNQLVLNTRFIIDETLNYLKQYQNFKNIKFLCIRDNTLITGYSHFSFVFEVLINDSEAYIEINGIFFIFDYLLR
jgi:hypothetical protein